MATPKKTSSFSRYTEKKRTPAAEALQLGITGDPVYVDASGAVVDIPVPVVIGSPFPETTGNLRGLNGLSRVNWFDGRFLTAGTLQAEQVYNDARARLPAQVHPAGIAWGLALQRGDGLPTLQGPIAGAGPVQGVLASTSLILNPGLAFDGVGRPIVVGSPYAFTISDLITRYKNPPIFPAGAGTVFAPCECAVGTTSPGTTGTVGLLPGAYLLVISPSECPEGQAKIYGTACDSSDCQADHWRGGFGLSLVRIDDAPSFKTIDPWSTRSLLSGWYYDVRDQLADRWGGGFPLGRFGRGPGPALRDTDPVPLALVYLSSAEGEVLFLDPWTPRRPIVATSAMSWAQTTRSAPTPSAAVSRLQQFQTMLEERLLASGLTESRMPPAEQGLYDLGFRTIPPYGFLPIRLPDPILDGAGDIVAEIEAGLSSPASGPSWLVDALAEAAGSWFRNTNVHPVFHVALHEDDLLEEMRLAEDKDPIHLGTLRSFSPARPVEDLTDQTRYEAAMQAEMRRKAETMYRERKMSAESLKVVMELLKPAAAGPSRVAAASRLYERSHDLMARDPHLSALTGAPDPAVDQALRTLLAVWGIEIGDATSDELHDIINKAISRELEIVKIILPLRSSRRRHPVLGAVHPELLATLKSQASTWLGQHLDLGADPEGSFWGHFFHFSATGHPFVMYARQKLIFPKDLAALLACLCHGEAAPTDPCQPALDQLCAALEAAAIAQEGAAHSRTFPLDLSLASQLMALPSECCTGLADCLDARFGACDIPLDASFPSVVSETVAALRDPAFPFSRILDGLWQAVVKSQCEQAVWLLLIVAMSEQRRDFAACVVERYGQLHPLADGCAQGDGIAQKIAENLGSSWSSDVGTWRFEILKENPDQGTFDEPWGSIAADLQVLDDACCDDFASWIVEYFGTVQVDSQERPAITRYIDLLAGMTDEEYKASFDSVFSDILGILDGIQKRTGSTAMNGVVAAAFLAGLRRDFVVCLLRSWLDLQPDPSGASGSSFSSALRGVFSSHSQGARVGALVGGTLDKFTVGELVPGAAEASAGLVAVEALAAPSEAHLLSAGLVRSVKRALTEREKSARAALAMLNEAPPAAADIKAAVERVDGAVGVGAALDKRLEALERLEGAPEAVTGAAKALVTLRKAVGDAATTEVLRLLGRGR